MKKLIVASILLIFASATNAFAVWPPETSLQDTDVSTAPPQNLPPIERLERDQRRLSDVLRDLKHDEEDYRRSLKTDQSSVTK